MTPPRGFSFGISWILAVFFLSLLSIDSHAQRYPTTARDSFPVPTEEAYEDPLILYEQKAAARALRQKNRRLAYQRRLPKKHHPRTAALLALIPGAGQIYNRRLWKVPIVWGGVGALGYYAITARAEYQCYKKAYLHQVDEDPCTNFVCPRLGDGLDDATLKIARDRARGNSELLMIGFTVFYGLTIVDAFVDAHLAKFDIDDDLSLEFQPNLHYNQLQRQWTPSFGIAVTPKIGAAPVLPVQF